MAVTRCESLQRNLRMTFWRLLLIGLGLSLGLGAGARADPASDEADRVLAAYVEAIGGPAALARIQSRTMESTISSGLLRMKVKSRLHRPDRFEDESSLLGFTAGAGYDGQRGWTRKGSKVEPVQGVELTRALRGHTLDWSRQYKTFYPVRRRLPDTEVEGVKLQVVELTTTTGEKEIWRFDAATGLLKQLQGLKFEKDKEPVPVLSTLSDYRLVDGLRLPFRMTGSDGSREFTVTVTSLVHNQPGAPIVYPKDD